MDKSIAEQALPRVWVKGRGLPPKRVLSFKGVIQVRASGPQS